MIRCVTWENDWFWSPAAAKNSGALCEALFPSHKKRARNVVPERRLQSNLVCMHLKCVRKCYVASPALPGAPLIKWRINDPNKKTSPYWLFHRIFRQFFDFSRKMKVRFRCRYLVYPPKYEVPRLRSTRHSAQLVLNSEIWTIWKPIASMGWSFYLGRPGVVNCPFN